MKEQRHLQIGYWKRLSGSRTRGTIRSTSEHFNRPKNMIHQDITQRLPIIDPELSKKVNRLLKLNKDQRPYRGGEALRQKFKSGYKKSKKKED